MSKSNPKLFVLDTNILLVDPHAIDKFEENYVVVPMIVLEELDGLKKRSNTEYEARQATNAILALTKKNKPGEPIRLRSGGHFILDSEEIAVSSVAGIDLALEKADNKILAIANKYRHDNAYPDRVVVVSNDATVRIKAHSMGIASEEYEAVNYRSGVDELYQPPTEIMLSDEQLSTWLSGNAVATDHRYNEGVLVKISDDTFDTGFVKNRQVHPYGGLVSTIIQPLNREQELALQIALDYDNKIVALVGQAGTGKTILALAVAIEQKLLSNQSGKIYIFRPGDQVADDVGFLPGNLDEKFYPHKRAIKDAYEVIQNALMRNAKGKKLPDFDSLTNDSGGGRMPILPINFIRGSTLHNAIVIVDEAQNFTAHQMKTILTRVGRNSKVIITGDPDQIDNRFITKRSCGLTHVIGNLRGNEIFSHVTLTQGERSEVAGVAANLL